MCAVDNQGPRPMATKGMEPVQYYFKILAGSKFLRFPNCECQVGFMQCTPVTGEAHLIGKLMVRICEEFK